MDRFIQPSIEILNIRIDEPITTLTDLVLAAVCIYAYFRIDSLGYTGRGKRCFKYYFLILGLGALSGGLLGHAFLYRLSAGWRFVSWFLTLGSVALIVQALTEIARPFVKYRMYLSVSISSPMIFILALFFTVWSGTFTPVKYYMTFGMIVMVGSLCYLIYRKTESRGALLILGAVGIGILSVLTFSYGWGLSPWFNHNDVSHVILSFVSFSIYRGAAAIMDASVIGP